MFNDSKARWDWCAKPYAEANHHPVAAISQDKSDSIVRLKAQGGERLEFDASASSDPDGDNLAFSWWTYAEAGTYAGGIDIQGTDQAQATVSIPSGADGSQIHLILEIHEVNEDLPLYDYRRVVIDLEGALWDGGTNRPSAGQPSYARER